MMKRRLLVVAALALARANAQENPPVVQIKASADTLRRNDSAARMVVGREELLQYGDITVLDALKRVPGISIADDKARMKGLGAGYTQILVNGQRPPPGFELENLAPDMVEKIEVIRAAVAEYSTQAIAGTINVVLRKTTGKPTRELRTSLEASPERSAENIMASMTDKRDDISYAVNGNLKHAHRNFDEYAEVRAGLSAIRHEDSGNHEDSWSFSGNGRLGWKPGPGQALDWQTFVSLNDLRTDSDTAIAVLEGPAYPQTLRLTARSSRWASVRSEIGWSATQADGARLETSFSAAATRFLRHMPRRAYAADGGITLDRVNDSEPVGIGVSWKGKYSMSLGADHNASAGWDSGFGVQRDHEVQQDLAESFDRSYHSRVSTFAAYVQDEWEIDKALSIYAGLRHEASITHSSGSDFDAAYSRASVSSPLLQGLWKLPGSTKNQLRAALTRTYKAPSASQLVPRRGTSADNSSVTPDYSGNPDLRPEIARGVDVGWEHYWMEGALFSVSVTARHIDDVIADAIAFENGRWVSAPRNIGDAAMRSLATELKFPLRDLKFSFSVGRNFSRVEGIPGPANRLARQAPWTGNAVIDYSKGAWGAGASVAYATEGWSRVSLEQSNYGGVQRTVEAYLSYKAGNTGKWRFTALNLARQPGLQGSIYNYAQILTRTPTKASVRISYESRY